MLLINVLLQISYKSIQISFNFIQNIQNFCCNINEQQHLINIIHFIIK